MMDINHVPQPLFGNVNASPIRPQDRRIDHSPVEFRTTYLNHLPVPVTVAWRSGLKCVLPNEPSFETNHLIVRTEITFQHAVKLDIKRVLSAVADDAGMELRALRDAFKISLQQSRFGSVTVILDYHLSIEQLKEYGGSVYYHELDTVFSLYNLDRCPPHPYSAAGRDLCLVEATPSKIGFHYGIEIIDNAGKYGDRYLNIGNKVYRAPVHKDSTRRDGVYIVANEPVLGEIEASEREVQYYPFEVAEEQVGLYRTPEEALNLGDLSQARKEELTNLEHEIQKGKAELMRERQKFEAEMMDKERALKEAEIERDRNARVIEELRADQEHKLKLERERVKDYYDDKSYERKDNNEILKFIPAVVVGIGAVIVAFKKIFG